MKPLRSAAWLAFAVLAPSAQAQVDAPAPPRRAHHALVYDASRQAVLLAGGSTPLDSGRSFRFFNDVWGFDGSRWSMLGESGDQMSGMRLVFDASAQRVVSFGGFREGSMGLLRVLDGASWRTIGDRSEAPAAEGGFVLDTRRQKFVSFGGTAGRGQFGEDTWEYAGQSWRRLAISSPPARLGHVMVYDARRGRVVLFGGMGSAPQGSRPPLLGDTWEFDGTAWTRRDVTGPSPRHSAGGAWDSRRGVVIVFGGGGGDSALADTWSWDGTSWRRLADGGPPPRMMGYLAYDARRDRVVMFGGRNGWPDGDLNDTWEWDGTAWRQVR